MSFEKLGVGGWWVHFDYNISSGPFLSSELIIGPGPGPGPELDNRNTILPLCETMFYLFIRLMVCWSL